MIFLDNAATTKPTELAIESFVEAAEKYWDNPSSTMREPGIRARRMINLARDIVAKELDADAKNIFFTSGATEGANWILRGFAADYMAKYIIADPMSHPCVYNTCEQLAHHKDVKWFPVSLDGKLNYDWLRDELNKFTDDTFKTLVCVTYVNNETGAVQDVISLANIVHCYPNCYLMLDITQAIPHDNEISQSVLGYDFAFASAHKFGGLRGTGFVYLKYPDMIKPLLTGGHQEGDARAGTENLPGIVAMADQLFAVRNRNIDFSYAEGQLRGYIDRNLPDFCKLNFPLGEYSIVSILLPEGMSANDVVAKLAMQEIYISAGSACSTGEDKPSRVLLEAGLTEDEARRTIRVSFNENNTTADIDALFAALTAMKGG